MTGERHVRRLVLNAADEALIRRGAILVEDALRTASLPDVDGGRVYVVRRLDLGRIDPNRPPASVALAIEQRAAQLVAHALHAERPGAAAAPVVYFHDAVEPFVALARRLAAGEPAAEWFWPLAVRGFTASMPAPQAWRIVVAGALATPAGGRALVELVESIGAAGVEALCAALAPADGHVLLARLGWSGVAEAIAARVAAALDGTVAKTPALPRLARASTATLVAWARRWGVADVRTAWLAAVLVAVERPALAEPAAMAREAEAIARLVIAAVPATDTDAVPETIDADPDVVPAAPEVTALADTEPVRPAGAAADPVALPRRPRSTRDLLPLASDAGGLFFLVRPLVRLGLPARLGEDGLADDFGTRLLRHIARRVRVSADDPIFDILAAEDDDTADLDALAAWHAACATWTRRALRMPLASLVRRRARLLATRTHLDVVFPLADADIRLRMLGLDIDPGWVGWLGRVVQFHYREARFP